MAAIGLLCVLVVTPAVVAAQAVARAGSATFNALPGWTRSAARSVVSFTAPDSGVVMHVLPGEELSGKLDAWVAKRWGALASRYHPVHLQPPTRNRSPDGQHLRLHGGVLQDARGVRFSVVFFAVAKGSRVQPLVVVARDAAALGRHGAVLDAVFASVRVLPPNQRPPPRVVALTSVVRPPAPPTTAASVETDRASTDAAIPGALDGLYVGIRVAAGPYASSGEDHIVFFPDGTYFWRLPQEGLAQFDRRRSQMEHPNFWGTYRREGRRVTLQLSTGMTEVAELDPQGILRVLPDRATLFPVARLNGARLDGVFARDGGQFPPIAFAMDGSFEDAGAMNVVGLSRPDLMPITVPPGRGTYRIANNTLTLAYSDGRVVRVAIFIPEPKAVTERPRRVVLNSYVLDRVR